VTIAAASAPGKAPFFCILQRNVKPEGFILKASPAAATTLRAAMDALQN
jgi:hypothetical protein